MIKRAIISGGGTGGHIFPAVAIADELKRRNPDIDILFVGAEGKMEMEKIPEAGYNIIGLPISGLQRSLTWSNVLFPVKVIRSYLKARNVIKDFKPDVVVGVGGYASWPTLAAATHAGVPTLIQEQNSYAGLANKRLARKVDRICVAYDGMEKFFPAEKISLTGNPVRDDLLGEASKEEARRFFGLDENRATIFIFGGSLGAGTLNKSVENAAELLGEQTDVQIIWQIGKFYADRYMNGKAASLKQVAATVFVDRMDLAYTAADLVICRAGALTISELSFLGKAAILVPSPNVAEDHQTKNAEFLVNRKAAIMIRDTEAENSLMKSALQIIHDKGKLKDLGTEALKLAKPRASADIVNEIMRLIKK